MVSLLTQVKSQSFLEFKFRVSCNQRVLVRLLVSLCKEQAYLTTCELNIHDDVVATKTTAVLASHLRMIEESDKRLSSIVLAVVVVLSLRIVRIVNHETYWSLVIPLSVSQSLAPELGRNINEDAAPVVVLPRKKTIELVLATVGYAA